MFIVLENPSSPGKSKNMVQAIAELTIMVMLNARMFLGDFAQMKLSKTRRE
jgi:hypothetical protein